MEKKLDKELREIKVLKASSQLDLRSQQFDESFISRFSEDERSQLESVYYPLHHPEIMIADSQIRSQVFSKHITYTISGEDSFGGFKTYRRYKEFLCLRKVLLNQ